VFSSRLDDAGQFHFR